MPTHDTDILAGGHDTRASVVGRTTTAHDCTMPSPARCGQESRPQMKIRTESHLLTIPQPANLKINERLNADSRICQVVGCRRPYNNFAFGQSPYPPPPRVVEALRSEASRNRYLPTAGLPQLRDLIADYYSRNFGFPCVADQVLVSPGSKEMIAIALAALEGTVVIPAPSWVSYLPLATILKKKTLTIHTTRKDGFKLTPASLEHAVASLHTPQKVLILNNPNNPTGAVYSEQELTSLTAVFRRHNIVVISDEIYARTLFDDIEFVSLASVYPEGTIVTGGLSKDQSCGGYRLGVGIFPRQATSVIEAAVTMAGSTYSCASAPVQYAALEAYANNPAIDDYVGDCARVNKLACRTMLTQLSDIPGIRATTPNGAFYVLVDLNDHRAQLNSLGLTTCSAFCYDLLTVEHTAVLPGEALLLHEDDFSVRCSFVDFDGAAALQGWRENMPDTRDDENAFARRYFPRIVEGIESIRRYIDQVQNGRKTQHAQV